MKLFKKALGVLLVVAMLMSVCAVMFTNVATAYTVKDNNLLALTFDDEKGLADYRAKSGVFDFSFEEGVQVDGTTGKYPVFTHTSYQGWSVVFGNENSVAAVSDPSAAHPNRFIAPAAGTYTFTYSYKYLAGASQPNFTEDIVANETFYVDFYKCAIADPNVKNGLPGKAHIGVKGTLKVSSLTEGVDYKIVDDIAIDGETEYQRVELIKDTQWFTTSFNITFSEDDITAGRTSICLALSAGNNDLIGDGGSDVEFKVAIDNVNISHAGAAEAATSAKTYVYDFKDAAGNPDTSSYGGHANFSGSDATGGNAKGAKIDVDGMHYCVENANYAAGGYNWAYKAYLKDPDFQLGDDTSGYGFLRIEANTTYYISMKFKLGTIASGVNNVIAGIGLTTGTAAGTVMVGTKSNTGTRVYVGDTDWHTVSVVIDSDTAFTKDTDTSNVGKYVCIMGAANVGSIDAEMIVESVTVTVVDKSTPVSQATSVLADFDKGLNEMYMPQGNALNNGTYTVIPDPLNSGRGNVLQFACTQDSTANFGMPAVSEMGEFKMGGLSSGYTVTPGRTYRVSFDVYLKTASGHDSTAVLGVGGVSNYLCNVSGVGNSGNKSGNLIGSAIFENGDSYAASRRWRSSNITGQWVNITYEYTPDNTANTYPYLVIAYSCKKNVVYCFDNVSITDVTDGEDTANGTVILDTQRGTMDDDATVTLPVGSIYEMPTPTREGYVFAGWTQSWDLANDMTYNTNTNVQNVVTISAANAPRTVLAVEPGITRYYAIWVAAKTYNFNDLTDKYLGSTFGQTGAGEFSSGDFYGEDIDGDGDYDAIGLDKAEKATNQYSINLGESKTVLNATYNDMFTLHEGVTYKITFNKKIDKLSTTNNKATIGLTRGAKVSYANVPVEGGPGYSWTKIADFTAAEDSYSEYTHEFKVFGMFNTSYNGGADTAGGSRNYKDGLHLVVANGSILFDSITIEPISYDDGRVQINGENTEGVEVDFDYENKTVSVTSTLHSTINSKSVRVFNNYYYGTADYEVSKLAYNKYGQAECISICNGDFSYANNTELLNVADPMTIRVIVDVIPETIKRSIRAEGTVGGKYQSAGLRFRYTLTDAQVAGATEIGFIATPSPSTADWYKNVDGTTVKKAVVFDGTNDIVYNVNQGSKDYQLIISNLTKEGVDKNAKDLTVYVVMYVTTGTETTYYFVGSSSYNYVKNAYADNGIVADGNGNEY